MGNLIINSQRFYFGENAKLYLIFILNFLYIFFVQLMWHHSNEVVGDIYNELSFFLYDRCHNYL